MISVIIPVFNEVVTIEDCLRAVITAPYEKQIIVIDDGSTDGTGEKLKELQRTMGFALLAHEKNMGKGSAIKTAQPHVLGSAVIIQDGDLEYNPNDYKLVLEPIINGKNAVVYGSRNLKKNKRHSIAFFLGGKTITAFANFLYAVNLTDINTCYKGFNTEIFKRIPLNKPRFDFCEEITAKVLRMGYNIIEVPIDYCPRTISQGKKIKPMDALRAIKTLIKYRFWQESKN